MINGTVAQEQSAANHQPTPPSSAEVPTSDRPVPPRESYADLVNIRPARPSEMSYVLHSWALTAFKSMPDKWRCSYPIWCALFPKQQEYLLLRAKVVIAASKDDDDVICGFCVYENNTPWIVHWVQVKARFKRHGLAEHLLGSVGVKPGAPVVHTFPMLHPLKQPAGWQHVPHWLT